MMTGVSAINEIRLGTAMRPLAMSAKDQTVGSETTDPTMTAATHSTR